LERSWIEPWAIGARKRGKDGLAQELYRILGVEEGVFYYELKLEGTWYRAETKKSGGLFEYPPVARKTSGTSVKKRVVDAS